MAEFEAELENWVPGKEDLAYWSFLRHSGRIIVGWFCLDEKAVFMWARPRDPLMRAAFYERHAGHNHAYVGHLLDKSLEQS